MIVVTDLPGSAPPRDTAAPAPPNGLVATHGDAKVDLVWGANSESDLAGYNVYRKDNGGGYLQINGPLVTGLSYPDVNVANGTMYYYVVTAEDVSTNESSNSNEASAEPAEPPDTTAPAPPSGLVATHGDAKVDLVWGANSESDLAGYNVYRKDNGGGYLQINGPLVTGRAGI